MQGFGKRYNVPTKDLSYEILGIVCFAAIIFFLYKLPTVAVSIDKC